MDSPDGTLRFSSSITDVDRAAVHRWLTEQSYWARDRPREVQDAAIDASRNVSVLDVATGRQVAYARVVTDGVTFAWLCDVIVDEAQRGRGAARLLVDGLVQALGPVWTLLITRDAAGLYARFGFTPLQEPDRWMEHRPRA